MAENSKIQWCDHTVNLWWGCSKVHTGCKNCYAEKISNTYNPKGEPSLWGEDKGRKLIKSAFSDLDKYQKEAYRFGLKFKIFVGSMMDIFEDSKLLINPTDQHKTTGDLRKYLFEKIMYGEYDNLIFLFLTKRPQNIWKMIPNEWSHGWKNIWFGTSVSDIETIKYANQLKYTLQYQNLFLSIEPQIENIEYINLKGISWVIQGGESGTKKRPFDIEWAYRMKDICRFQNVPYFFKQIDKIQAIPEDLLIREFPNLNN